MPVATVGVDDQPLLGGKAEQQFAVYPRRFYILFLFSLAALQQSCTWTTFSPIVAEVRELYSWSKSTVDLLAAWGSLVYLPAVLISPKVVERLGLRASITVAAACTCACNVLRCLTVQAPYAAILAHVGQILNAAAGPLVLATPSKLSMEWFAPTQRTLATSVAAMASYTGVGFGFLLALPVHNTHDVQTLLYGEAAASVVILGLCLVDHACCRAHPELPPSASAASTRPFNLFADMAKLARSVPFMILTLTFGLCMGTYSGWSGVLDLILEPLHFSQSTASWLGFASTVGTVVGGVVVGHVVGKLGRYKLSLLLAMALSVVSFAWFSLLANRTLPKSRFQLYFSCTLASLLVNCTTGPFYEAAVEESYPIDEVSVLAMMTFVFNVASSIYMLAGSHIPAEDMNWILTGVCVFCFTLLLFYKETRVRTAVDNQGGSADKAHPAADASPPSVGLSVNVAPK